ncbi:hypothetical protein AU255_05560 [Methyloprofundus sedimenti]|uniref:LppC family lipoprotein n=1 Tax=Methyloprofundus sedimenti TaxID=1420851 RepID=A0A1V8M6Z5_9GAMM|nr:penicillin-binding protein activator [Methyloprofundus sedimenti]OQK17350.1 hypothetical protein AU255_05560 [Methyloprofundus sedimenti]
MKRFAELILKSLAIKKFSLLSVLLLISGCALHTGEQDPIAVIESAEERKAGQLFEQGNYSDAALLYQRLAQKTSARQNILRLQAAQAFLKIPLNNKAKITLELIAPEKLNSGQRNQFYLMYAQLSINSGDIERALDYLMRISVPSLSRTQKTVYFKMTAFTYALTGQIVKSVHERIALDLYLYTEQEKESNNSAILELLSLMPEHVLQEQRQQQQKSIVYSGWLGLEQTRREFPGGTQRKQAFNDWGVRYPGHPAQVLISSGYFLVSGFQLANVSVIAVLLPESGPYSPYAAALKAGFIEAYKRQENIGMRPDVRFYDTLQTDISVIYRKAVADGAQLVIGPLNKKFIKELAERNDFSVPVMALNYVEGLVKSNLYQFALSPIDEVQQAVKQASKAGHRNAIILAPKNTEGKRMEQYFQNAWEVSSGHVLQIQRFNPGVKDFSFPVREMLGINESQYRFQRLQKVIGNIEYEPRRRQDVDVIFLAASEKNARLINPQFYHNRAGSVAVYGLSKVYQGRMDKNKDIDLEGVTFCTIPWLFDETYQGNLSMSSLQDIWAKFPEKYLSLFAFGIDAYAVVAHLNDLATMPYYGATGGLLLNDHNRIERHLACAKFKGGEALVVESAEKYDTELPAEAISTVN